MSGRLALSSLLSILNDYNLKPGSSVTPVANATTIDLLHRLLSRDDYVGIAEKTRQESDVMNLLEFILHVLRHRYLSNPDDISQRARRLMFKIISKTPVVPRSFIVTGISMPDKRDYIGRGGYGNVFKGKHCGTVVALKVLYKNDANNLAFCREALMWGSLKHNFVLPFIGIHEEDDGTAFLVSPYMENGTLAQWRKNTNPLTAQITDRMLEVAQGMEYIHSEGVVHGDLRGENVLLDVDLRVQIADFGLTRLLDATNTQSGAKHLNFAAPELFGCHEDDVDDPSAEDPPRTQMSDVYAFGCTYYEIHYDSIPFAGRREIQIVTLVSRGRRPPRQDEPPLSDGVWELIQHCWVTGPPERPRMKDVAEQMMAISQCLNEGEKERKKENNSLNISPPISARNDGMFQLQDASLSLPTSNTTPFRGKPRRRIQPLGQLQAGLSPQAYGPWPVARLQVSENRWDRKALASTDSDAPGVVDRKVRGKVRALLNKLTMEKFDSISDQIIQWANRSENQKDGRTLIQIIRLIFERATSEATWSEMYARLCRKMMERISSKVHDEGIKDPEGKPIVGGELFRKYLLKRCQESFERGWIAKEAVAIKDANERNGGGEVALYSEEYYAAQKARRCSRGLGLIKFIGELFKLRMLTERTLHEYIKKLIGTAHDPEEEEIESLCMLMTSVGLLLDTQRGRAHMDVYFQRMKELTQNLNVSPRMRFMLQDVLELRQRKWVVHNAAAGPAMLAQIHEAAAKEKEVTPSEAADAKIKDDVEEFFNVKNLDKAEVYFSTLHSQYHHSLVNRLTSSAVESKEPDAKLVADLFTRAKSKGLCSPDAFEEGLTPTAEMIEDIVIDAPKAWTLFATMVNGAELDEEHRTRLASKCTDSDKLLGLLLS